MSPIREDNSLPDPYQTVNQLKPLLVVISGPSGVGKDTIMHGMRDHGAEFYQVVTATTRPQRPHETDGADYHFVSKQRFAEMIENKELLEHAVVYGDYKGIPKFEVRRGLESGTDVVLRVDVQGAATIRHMVPEAVTIFLVASSEEEMVERLRQRDTEDAGTLALRIATAREELHRLPEFDYVVVNRQDRLDEAVVEILAIMTAERRRVDWKSAKL
ncbi:MAG: guanylate kinase [Chloroflexota bacterium]|nr:guanylate kinase [Chloroflexota bacterium]